MYSPFLLTVSNILLLSHCLQSSFNHLYVDPFTKPNIRREKEGELPTPPCFLFLRLKSFTQISQALGGKMCSSGMNLIPFVQLMLFIKLFGSWFYIIYPVTDSQSPQHFQQFQRRLDHLQIIMFDSTWGFFMLQMFEYVIAFRFEKKHTF